MRPGYSFHIDCGGAAGPRRGRFLTPRGEVPTPAFMPVGTAASVKAASPEEVKEAGSAMILANTYHLLLRPGAEVIAGLGGLHRFSGWAGPILTDSGGFQVFSLAALGRIDDDGVTFRSHLDGSEIRLTPETSIAVQELLGSDVMMAFDECTGAPADREKAARAVERTWRWAERSLAARRGDAALFGIVQGGLFEDLRRSSAAALTALPFDGYAIGGVSVGETPEEICRVVEMTAPLLPEGRPRYLMGVGTPADLLEMVRHGIDLFDCVMPTRNARNGSLFVRGGRLNIRNQRFRDDPRPVEEGCPCPACSRHSRAYLRHLHQAGEIYGLRLNTLHNLTHYQRLMEGIRGAIAAGTLDEFRQVYLAPPGD